MRYTYLLINVCTVLCPLLLSFDKRVAFYKSWEYLWPGMLITGLLFWGWDVLFTTKGVWSFKATYLIGLTLFGLPVEEVLFFLTVPFACMFIYACLNYYIRWEIPQMISKIISVLLAAVAILVLIFYHDRLYTLVTFVLLLLLLIVIQFVIKVKWLPRFYLAYLVALIPFFIVNGLLTAIPVVLYQHAAIIGKRAGTIPVEDFFYAMGLLLMNVCFFEYFKTRHQEHQA